MSRNKRQVFRQQLDVPFAARMRVIEKESPVTPEFNHKIYIHDIGLEGIGFSVDLEVPMHTDMEFSIKLNDEPFRIRGEVVWGKPNDPNDPNTRASNFFGVKFYLKTEKESSLIFQEVNRFAIKRHRRKQEIREMMKERLNKQAKG
ncbi:PilZ domain-containing protein [Bacillus sp. es.036]|uniref:PilZ domain-containing protein n=1 Tax=Bacillus sp. es.036 TaxID=1761764 RepID=UPI000BF3501A|nr:PilZ domain-containing protein [Bacillus sp. es.036]PFG15427.1 PilZ domain-containing protein [Bacillus sp. es.036]